MKTEPALGFLPCRHTLLLSLHCSSHRGAAGRPEPGLMSGGTFHSASLQEEDMKRQLLFKSQSEWWTQGIQT